MARLKIRHITEYRYPRPVTFGEHRLMFRPRDSHDIRLISTRLHIAPRAKLRWLHDVFGNSIAIASFGETADRLTFESEIVVDLYGIGDPSFTIEDYARTLPFDYAADERPDLRATMTRQSPDPDGSVYRWARQFLDPDGPTDTIAVLLDMTRAIKRDFAYVRREAPGTQPPGETLDLRAGSCRDFALLMMEGSRALGLAAAFVTGYLYDPQLDNGPGEASIGAGATHAWCRIYLPGMGWTEFDPTNGNYSGTNLVRVGTSRTPEQAIPLEGSYSAYSGDPPTMTVEVDVTRIGDAPASGANAAATALAGTSTPRQAGLGIRGERPDT